MDTIHKPTAGDGQLALESLLQGFALVEKERAVCLAALGEYKTARDIANDLQANRSEIFDLLRHLSRLGFIRERIADGERLFSFAEPQALQLILYERQLELDRLNDLFLDVTAEIKSAPDTGFVWPTKM